MPRRVHVKKDEVPVVPLVETVGEDVAEPTSDTGKSPRFSTANPTTRIPRKKKMKKVEKVDERAIRTERKFNEHITGTKFGSDIFLRDIAPDMVLDGWSVNVRCENIPTFGEPLTATFSLVRPDTRLIDEVFISTTVETLDLLRCAPDVVQSLVELHRSLNVYDET